MRLAFVNQDPGISPERPKGAAVHLLAMRAAFRALGVELQAFDQPDAGVLARELVRAHLEAPFELVYERYALGCDVAARFARSQGVAHVLEVNAPLAEEASRWRGVNGLESDERLAARERFLFEHATRVIAVSRAVAHYARERGAATVDVFPNGVDVERFRPRAPDDGVRAAVVPSGRVALGFHGRLRPWHGFELLVQASSALLKEGAPIHLVLVGEGPFETALSGLVPDTHVTRLGWLSQAEVAPVVAAFDLLPLSYSPLEPCYFSPLKLAEAMACGVVPVVPRLGDLPAIVQDGVNGRVWEPGSLSAFTEALRQLVHDHEQRSRLARGAIGTAARLDWKRIARFALEAAGPRQELASPPR